jgi:Pyruvate/2-oxoacid:ferredoxin oxidoreductase delta subunit
MMQRQIIEIDENKCDGCGQCVSACAEGAIQIIDGKARLVSDVYCDGLGACLGKCPQDAITIIQREAEPFDQTAAEHRHTPAAEEPGNRQTPSGCPGMSIQEFPANAFSSDAGAGSGTSEERSPVPGLPPLSHWPIQLHLVPPTAPFLSNADLFLVADCVPFACGEFHHRILRRRPLVIGCPKLDDGRAYVQKLVDIFAQSTPQSLTVVHMEVPCCTNLLRIAAEAIRLSGATLPVAEITISRSGQILSNGPVESASRAAGEVGGLIRL